MIPSLSTLSLRTSIALAMAFGILLPALVVGPLLAVESYHREIETRVSAMLKQYGAMLEQAMPTPVWLADASAAQPFVDSVMLNPDVIRIVVEDASLGNFVTAERAVPPGGQIVSDVRPLLKEGKQIGRITIDMTTAIVEQQILTATMKGGAALLLQVMVSFAALFAFFEHRLMRPLRQLRKDATRLSGGDLEQSVAVIRADEIGELAEGLDRMRAKLGEHIVEIHELNTSLEQRVNERTQALHTANQELLGAMSALKSAQSEIQRSERLAALGALVAGVAHELNTPIGTCVTVASTLHDLTTHMDKSMQVSLTRSALATYIEGTRQACDLLMRNLNKAAELISSFKQVAVDRTSAQRRRFVLNQTEAETLMAMGPVIKRSGHSIQCDIPLDIVMTSYPGQLGQIITNLINNAFLHGFENRPNGQVTISAHTLADEQIELRIANDGECIPAANLKRIFDPFYTTKMGRGGTGLGLNIVYNLVIDVFGGAIRVESDVATGTCFILTLPLCAPDVSVLGESMAKRPE